MSQIQEMVGCAACADIAVRVDGPLGWDIDATTAALAERVRSGQLRELRCDVPVSEMLDLLTSELMYTIVAFLECRDCGQVIMWGLCIRGVPIYRFVEHDKVRTWPWGPVPARELWRRS